jgi:CRP/FNR family transcriptional regulator, cyclic AMP receptor protein
MRARVAAGPLRVLGLRGIRLFDGLDAFSLDEIARQCRWRSFKRNERVISRRATDRDVYLVIAGTVRVAAHSPQGRGVIFRDISAGELFGELSALDQRARSADVIAVSDAVLASMSPETFHGVLTQYPAVRQRLFRNLAASVRELTDRLLELSTLDVEHRIAVELLRCARAAGVTRNASCVQPTPTHRELAERVGTSREQVTRTLLAFSRRGLVVRDRRRVLLVPDVASLEKLAGERSRA